MYRISGVGDGGISADLPDRDVDPQFVREAHNVTAAGGTLRVSYGFEDVADTPEQIFHIQPIDDARKPRSMLLIAENKVYDWDGATIKNITTNSITPPTPGDKWSSSQMGGMALFTHHGDTPRVWSPPAGGVEQYLPWSATETWKDKAYTAGVIKNYKNFIVVAHTNIGGTEAPRMVRWSASVSDTYTLPYWDPAPENDAGFAELADLSTGIIDMLTMGDSLVIYGSDTAYMMQWVGGTYIHRFQKLKHIPGIIGKNMALPVLNSHFVIGQTDIYLHSGGLPTSIVDKRIRRTIFNALSDDRIQHSFLVKNWQLDEIWLCIPKDTDNAVMCFAWNWKTNTWTTRDIPASKFAASGVTPSCIGGGCPTWDTIAYPTWDSWPGSWGVSGGTLSNSPEVLFAGIDHKLHQRRDSYGVFTPSKIERIGIELGNYEEEYTLLSAYPSLEGSPAKVQIGIQKTEGGAVKWSKPQLFTPGVTKKIDLRADNLTGSLLSYKIYSEVPSVFEFSGLEMRFSRSGKDG